MATVRRLTTLVFLAALAAYPAGAQDSVLDPATTPDIDTTLDTTTTTGTTTTSAGGEGSEVSSAIQIANQAFQMLSNRQFLQAKQLYEDAAGSDANYQRMAQFADNIVTRYEDLMQEMWELEMKYNNPLEPEFTIENITREDLEKNLDMQMRMQMSQGDLLGEFTLAELGLDDAKDADTLTLGEYLGWRRRKTVDFKIYDEIMKRVYDRQLRYARMQFLVEQRQQRATRRQELRQIRLEVQGGGFSTGVGGMGGMGGMGGYGGGMGGGMGGMGGGFGGGMGGGFGGGMGMMGGGMMGGF